MKLVMFFALSLLTGINAFCQNNPKVDVFGGISVVTLNPIPFGAVGLNHGAMLGWDTAITAHLNRTVGLTADVAGYYRSYNALTGSAHLASYTLLFGPTVTIPLRHRDYLRPFVHALFGVEHANSTGFLLGSSTNWAVTLGGGYDVRFNHNLGMRIDMGWFRRNTFDTMQNNFRFATGLVINLPGRKD